jgi:polyisoprenoid-binding protein YceI
MRKFVLFAMMAMTAVAVAAQPRAHTVDKAHSQINFIAEARFVSANGTFDRWDAEVLLNLARIESSSFKVTIDAASINTRVSKRDDHLRSSDFFDVAKYPQITLVSKKITKMPDGKLAVTGDLTMHGVTKQIEVLLTQVFYENGRGRYRTSFDVNRKEYGLVYNSRLNPIEDIVKIQVDINVQAPVAKPAGTN